jgi:hypothetical protein
MNLLKLFTGLLSDVPPPHSALVDPTFYRINTGSHEYEGRILYQNDVVINFNIGHKVVKILKTNIVKIHVLSATSAPQRLQDNSAMSRLQLT